MIRILLFSFCLLGLDIATKGWARMLFAPLDMRLAFPYGGVGVFPDFCGISFSLNLATNTGAAWSLFQGHPTLLFCIRMLVIGGLILYLLKKRKEAPFWLWLVATGALGNALDYLIYGHVIDFLHFVLWGYSFPVFNVADILICVGGFGLFLFPKSQKALA